MLVCCIPLCYSWKLNQNVFFCCCFCFFNVDYIKKKAKNPRYQWHFKHLISIIKGMCSWFLLTLYYSSYSIVSCLLKTCVFFSHIFSEMLTHFCCFLPENMYTKWLFHFPESGPPSSCLLLLWFYDLELSTLTSQVQIWFWNLQNNLNDWVTKSFRTLDSNLLP